MSTPTIISVRRTNGVAGQVSFTAQVQYPSEPVETVTFVGQIGEYGPVVMIPPSGHQIFVTDPGRHGVFGPEWVQRFFA